jgi:HlyD family secretion protein
MRVYGLGTVEAKVVAKLGFEVAGRLAEVAVDQGNRIEIGRTLARLDASEQQAKLAQAEAELRQADAAVAQAKARLERAKALLVQRRSINDRRQALVRRGTVSQEAAEDAEAGSAVAAADVAVATSDQEAARGAVEAAKARTLLERAVLAKFTLSAPFDAMVVERLLEPGATVAPGAIALSVVDPSTVWVRAFVDESLAGRLAVGQPATITLRSHQGESLTGRIARIDIENDRVSEERKVHVAFDQIPADFHLGEQAEILVDTSGGRS